MDITLELKTNLCEYLYSAFITFAKPFGQNAATLKTGHC